jgi:hypothetical protein
MSRRDVQGGREAFGEKPSARGLLQFIAWLKSLARCPRRPRSLRREAFGEMSKEAEKPPKRKIREAFGEMSKEAEKRWQAEQLSPADPKHFQRNPLWCHIFLNNHVPDFELVPLLIGKDGCHFRKIYKATSVKIRVRGRGSGFLERNSKEAPVPLMVAITSNHPGDFKMATRMMIARLGEVKVPSQIFCQQQKDAQGYRNARQQKLWRFGEMSKEAETVLYEFLS